jgi:hypothetical protein
MVSERSDPNREEQVISITRIESAFRISQELRNSTLSVDNGVRASAQRYIFCSHHCRLQQRNQQPD